MIKKTLLLTAVGSLAVTGAKLASVAGSNGASGTADKATTVTEPDLLADCPWCEPDPGCFPGDPCSNCG